MAPKAIATGIYFCTNCFLPDQHMPRLIKCLISTNLQLLCKNRLIQRVQWWRCGAYPDSRTPVSRPPFGYANNDRSVGHLSPRLPIAPSSGNMAMVSAPLGNHTLCKAWLPTTTPTVAHFVLSPSRPWRHGVKCEFHQRFSPLHNLLRYILHGGI